MEVAAIAYVFTVLTVEVGTSVSYTVVIMDESGWVVGAVGFPWFSVHILVYICAGYRVAPKLVLEHHFQFNYLYCDISSLALTHLLDYYRGNNPVELEDPEELGLFFTGHFGTV